MIGNDKNSIKYEIHINTLSSNIFKFSYEFFELLQYILLIFSTYKFCLFKISFIWLRID